MTAPTQVFDLLDLVNLVAAAKGWELQFDSGPGDYREVMFHKMDRKRDGEIPWSSTSLAGSNGRRSGTTARGTTGTTWKGLQFG